MLIETAGPPAGRRLGPFVFSPDARWSAQIPQGATAGASIAIHHDAPAPARITGVRSGGGDFVVTLETLKEGERYLLNVRTAPSLAVGTHRQTIKLLTDSKEARRLEIPLEALVAPAISTKPERLDLGTLPISQPDFDGAKLERFLYVSQRGGSGFELKSASSTLPFLVLQPARGGSAQTRILRVSLDPTLLRKGTHKGRIRLETDDPRAPVLEVPVTLKAR
jgi:hypothetical protein